MGIKHNAVKSAGQTGLASEWNDEHKIDGDVDFTKNQAITLVVHKGTSFPAGAVAGQIFYRTDLSEFYFFDSSDWICMVHNPLTANLDFQQNQAIELVIEKGLAFPASPVSGQLFFRTDLLNVYFYDGSSWKLIGSCHEHQTQYYWTNDFINGDGAWHIYSALTWSFTLTKTSKILVDVGVMLQNVNTSTGGEAYIKLRIDDVDIDETEHGFIEEDTDGLDIARELSINYVATLNSGSHTIKVKVYLGAGVYRVDALEGHARYVTIE